MTGPIPHSHGHYSGQDDFSDHVSSLLQKGISSVYTLAGGHLWVQWVDQKTGTIHDTPEKIYNVCAAMGGKGC